MYGGLGGRGMRERGRQRERVCVYVCVCVDNADSRVRSIAAKGGKTKMSGRGQLLAFAISLDSLW